MGCGSSFILVRGVNMSELIDNNRKKQEQMLKKIILELHAGKSVDEVKEKFKQLIKAVGPNEIASLENALMQEGISEEEIKSLCDVHLSIFEDSLILPEESPKTEGHPLEVLKQENRKLEEIASELRTILAGDLNQESAAKWQALHRELMKVDDHYQKKEHLLFPYLEKKGVYGPPSVMWMIHDEIRDELKGIAKVHEESPGDLAALNSVKEAALAVIKKIEDMIGKEEKVLFPLVTEKFDANDWEEIKQSMPEFTEGLVEVPQDYKEKEQEAASITAEGIVDLGSGKFTIKELAAFLNSLPLDITFVDKNREVRYFTEGKERIFARPRTVLGRKVEKCHPPESVHIVDRIVNELESGKRESADFWINLKGKMIYIRYLPVRTAYGEFLGVLEITQDITEIQKLTGEKRLLDEE